MSKKNEVMSMHNLTDQFMELMEVFETSNGEITEENEAKFNEISEALVKKTDNVVEWVKYQDSIIELAEDRVKKLKTLIDQIKNRTSNFETYLGGCINKMETKELKGEMYTIKLRKPSDVVYIEDEKLIPVEYLVIPKPEPAKPDLKAIKDAINSGEKVAGCIVTKSKKISVIYGFKK